MKISTDIGTYILGDDRRTITKVSTLAWAQWFETHPRRMARTHLKVHGVEVSTVFLGLDHNYALHGPPILFETMVFGGKLDQEQRRYATADEAILGHEEMVERVHRIESQHKKEKEQ